jgi:hypothetical protein
MMTELGRVTHTYWYEDGVYLRRPLAGGQVEVWSRWASAWLVRSESRWAQPKNTQQLACVS